MNEAIEFGMNKASEAQIAEHLLRCDADFVPPLSKRVRITDYAEKIANKATRFEAWSGDTLVGLAAVYCNDQEKRIAYITSISVLKAWTGKGIATNLMNRSIAYAKALGMRQFNLEVAKENTSAIRLYEKVGFVADKAIVPFVTMCLYL